MPFLQAEFDELHVQLSPDSRWMAYTSDETGQWEVYVHPFPSGDSRWRISIAGGQMPRWRGDGKELFYTAAGGEMTAATLKAVVGPKVIFEAGAPVPLFESRIMATPGSNGVFQYDVSADSKHFLVDSVGAAGEQPASDSGGELASWVEKASQTGSLQSAFPRQLPGSPRLGQ